MASSLNTIVAGVDFGTTKTCVSYCFRNGGRSSNPTIHSWTPTGCTENMIPSVVSYTPDGSCLYGPEVSPQMKSLVWQKLLIEGPGERNAFNPAGIERAPWVRL
ncbi:uncharacterized protein LDX57_000437 [Aspergillus melleus]|uniref:uncharacterized protein n=1 Tax=Aspergillus melleus TaxID=138277 RepID=UPI001E8E8233|nr:uncharacterized protein LDX57_000437 [Aspergillus melleus]KAH8422683.1 hypothetical protein LDX57_000437 [Aspergillus melleus]